MRRTAISSKPSRRKVAFELELAAVTPEVLARGCEFIHYANPAQLPDPIRLCGGRTLVHHAKGRRVRDANAPKNLRCLCAHHHDYVHGETRWAREVGLMVSRLT